MSRPMNTFGADTDDDVTDWGQENVEEKYIATLYATTGEEMARRVGRQWESLTERERSYYDMLADVNRRMLER